MRIKSYLLNSCSALLLVLRRKSRTFAAKTSMKKNMKTLKTLLVAIGILPLSMTACAQTTLDDCRRMAVENYPLLKKYGLIKASTDYTVNNIKKGYLPQVTLSGRATYQSGVAELPGVLQDMMAQHGYDPKGLGKDQYSIALDVSQVLYDGGAIRAGRGVAKAEGEVRDRQTDVEMYALHERINGLYFGILLAEDRLRLNEEMQTLLLDNCRKLEAMLENGVATQADVDAVRAEYLNSRQQHTEIAAARDAYRNVLGLFIGRDTVGTLVKPQPVEPAGNETLRPEMSLFDAQSNRIAAQLEQADASVRPSLSLFAQGYYGYPGYNMFEDMFSRGWSLNGMVGIRLNWNIGRFYTHANDKQKLRNSMLEVENAREVFLFSNRIRQTEDRLAVDKYRRMMREDDEIMALRTSVRKAQEARLEHGIINVNDLLQEISRENRAGIERSTHEIEMLKSMYELQNTLNR